MKTSRINAIIVISLSFLAMIGCSRADRRRFFGIPEVETKYINAVPSELRVNLRIGEDITVWQDSRFKTARYINCWLSTEDDMRAELPFYNHENNTMVNCTINRENGAIAVMNYTEGAPWATQLVIEFVE